MVNCFQVWCPMTHLGLNKKSHQDSKSFYSLCTSQIVMVSVQIGFLQAANILIKTDLKRVKS